LYLEKQMTISAAQCRAARALLDKSQDWLADAAQVSRATVADFERSTGFPMRANLAFIQSALEEAGVEFIPENGGGAGVRLREVELEYNRTVRAGIDGVVMRLRYRGRDLMVTFPRAIVDDIGHLTSSTDVERAGVVTKRLPVFLGAIRGAIEAQRVSHKGVVWLERSDFPDAVF
jgi:hypothetical protein